MTVDQDLTPLMVAARDEEYETVKELLRENADVAARDQEGWTAATYAALNHDATIIKALIAEGADLNSKDNQGMTPLMHVASDGQASVAEFLGRLGDPHKGDYRLARWPDPASLPGSISIAFYSRHQRWRAGRLLGEYPHGVPPVIVSLSLLAFKSTSLDKLLPRLSHLDRRA
jgi:ankyrin repeat protein